MQEPAGFRGVFINLADARSRRRKIDEQLKTLGLVDAYVRLDATGPDSVPPPHLPSAAAACFHSHLRALRLAEDFGGLVHIIEDDVILTPEATAFARLLPASGVFDQFDIVFLDMWLDAAEKTIRLLQRDHAGAVARNRVAMVDMRNIRVAANASYIPNPRSLGRLIALLGAKFAAGTRDAVDVTIDRMVKAGAIRAGVALPFLTGTDLDEGSRSSIQNLGNPNDRASHRALILLRMLFFVGCDIDNVIVPQLESLRAEGEAPDGLLDLVDRAIGEARRLALTADKPVTI